MNAEYVDFATAKGLRSRVILMRHILRNALISTVTLFGLRELMSEFGCVFCGRKPER